MDLIIQFISVRFDGTFLFMLRYHVGKVYVEKFVLFVIFKGKLFFIKGKAHDYFLSCILNPRKNDLSFLKKLKYLTHPYCY